MKGLQVFRRIAISLLIIFCFVASGLWFTNCGYDNGMSANYNQNSNGNGNGNGNGNDNGNGHY